MTALLTLMVVSLTVSIIMAALALILGRKTEKDREKLTPFECGFDPYKKARAPFSLRFFLVTIIFLVFDVELALLMPLGVVGLSSDLISMSLAALLLTMILVLGLIHEWNQGALTWVT